jgi:dihydrofolate reductase
MRKIVSSLFISLDGVVESPDQWTPAYWSDDLGEAMGRLMGSSDAMLLGRITYEEFAPAWSAREMADDPGADFMNNTPKFVVSKTLESADWTNSTVVRGDLAEEVGKLKQQPGGDITISGSGTLVRSLLADGLVDELHLFVHPVVVGHGKRLFPEGVPEQALKLASATAFGTGVVHLAYQPQTS